MRSIRGHATDVRKVDHRFAVGMMSEPRARTS